MRSRLTRGSIISRCVLGEGSPWSNSLLLELVQVHDFACSRRFDGGQPDNCDVCEILKPHDGWPASRETFDERTDFGAVTLVLSP